MYLIVELLLHFYSIAHTFFWNTLSSYFCFFVSSFSLYLLIIVNSFFPTNFKIILYVFIFLLSLGYSYVPPKKGLKSVSFLLPKSTKISTYFSTTYTISPGFSHSVASYSSWPHESQHTRPPCPSPTPGVHSDSCPLSLWCHPAILSSVVPFSSCPQSLPASESFPMSQLFT